MSTSRRPILGRVAAVRPASVAQLNAYAPEFVPGQPCGFPRITSALRAICTNFTHADVVAGHTVQIIASSGANAGGKITEILNNVFTVVENDNTLIVPASKMVSSVCCIVESRVVVNVLTKSMIYDLVNKTIWLKIRDCSFKMAAVENDVIPVQTANALTYISHLYTILRGRSPHSNELGRTMYRVVAGLIGSQHRGSINLATAMLFACGETLDVDAARGLLDKEITLESIKWRVYEELKKSLANGRFDTPAAALQIIDLLEQRASWIAVNALLARK